MSIESISLIDAVYSARLTMAGLPALANVQAAQTLVEPTSDPYAIPTSSLPTLSGYGQLLSAASRSFDGLQGLLGENSNFAKSSDEAVVTATATAAATAGAYSISVTNMATPQSLVSGYFTSRDENVFSVGSFNIAVGSNDPVTITLAENEGLIAAVGYAWGSLDSLAAVINDSGAGVTASVENGTYGYQLKLVADATGTANTITLSANNDPLDGGDENLAALAFTQSQEALDASYSIDYDGAGGAGPISYTSSSNENISIVEGLSFNIESAGTATITVASSPFVPTDLTSVTTAANQLVQNYNALIGTSAQLLAVGGALNGDTTTATPLTQALYNATLADYDSGNGALNSLAELGITGTGVATGPLSINSGMLTTAFGTDATATASLLTKVTNALQDIIAGYLGESGTIVTQAWAHEVNDMTYLDNHTAGDYLNLANDVKLYVLQKSLASASTPIDLPPPPVTMFDV